MTPRSAPSWRSPSARSRPPRGRRPASRPSGTVRRGEVKRERWSMAIFFLSTRKKKKLNLATSTTPPKNKNSPPVSTRLLRPRPGVRRGRGLGGRPQRPAAAARTPRDRLLPGGPVGPALQARGAALRRRLGRGRAGEGGRENGTPSLRPCCYCCCCCLRRRVRRRDRARESGGHAGRSRQAPRRAVRRGEAAGEGEDREVPGGGRGQDFPMKQAFSPLLRSNQWVVECGKCAGVCVGVTTAWRSCADS